MRLDDEQESGNFEVQGRGRGGFNLPGLGGGLPFGGGKMGCGTIIILIILAVVFKVDVTQMLGGGGGMVSQSGSSPAVSRDSTQLTDIQHWSLKVLGSTERVWGALFQQAGQKYQEPVLVFYDRDGMSGCGAAQSAMGPFYCPADNKVYLDTSFFQELKDRFGAPGDFAQAYVIAHEVGHHIQTITGISDKVRAVQQRSNEAVGNAEQVKMELQADCYAGVWAAHANVLEPGDVEEGLKAAHAIGDDTLMKSAGRVPVEASFTHGTSEQRMAWLKRGLESGNPANCDTFGGK